MKKLLIFMLVLGMASAASAVNTAWFETVSNEVTPSQDIAIMVKADFDVLGLDLAVDGPPAASLGSHGLHEALLRSTFPNQGIVVNDGTLLIRGISGADPTFVGVPAGEVVYSFMYHVPDEPPSTQITITSTGDWFDPTPPPSDVKTLLTDVQSGPSVTSLTPLVLHIIPEPMTIALLGLGGLFLRRRK